LKKKYFILLTLFTVAFAQDNQSFEEELKLFGADDFLIFEDNTVSKKSENVEEVQDSVAKSDSLKTAEDETVRQNSENAIRRQPASSLLGATAHVGGRGEQGEQSPDTSQIKISVFDTASVMRESSIDFSRNLSEYRSPQKALFYSLLLPGFGQAYNKKYWRTGLYAAMEIGMIAGAVYFRKDSKKIQESAYNFADENFKRDRVEKFYDALTQYAVGLFDEEDSVDVSMWIFGENAGFVNEYDSITKELTKHGYQKYLEELDADFYGDSYGAGSVYGVHGWNDATPKYGSDYPYFYYGINVEDLDSIGLHIMQNGKTVFGFSENQNKYNSILEKSRQQGRRSSVFVVGIFANHIASAADAFVSAIINNRKLLKEEKGESTKVEDILSRISIESDTYFGAGNNLTTRLGLTWRF
jgi:hypothetical protein